jgi:nicotinate-nucleotide pyrophosphorylase (carboxylating)
MRPPSLIEIEPIILAALREDLASGDVTTDTLFPRPIPAKASIIAKQSLTLAGIVVAEEVFRLVDPGIRLSHAAQDGAPIRKGQSVITIEGTAQSILAAERVALNFLQHLSGIATLTHQFCEQVTGYATKIVDTRKTTPGLRVLQKWAVRLGGGHNHRCSLGDGILVKDNHLMLLAAEKRSIAQACRNLRQAGPHGLRIIVEAESMAEVTQALAGQADVILLDNMTPAEVKHAAMLIRGRAVIEVSGGVTLDHVRAMAQAGANVISIGALTHSAPAADLSLELVVPRPKGRARAKSRRP